MTQHEFSSKSVIYQYCTSKYFFEADKTAGIETSKVQTGSNWQANDRKDLNKLFIVNCESDRTKHFFNASTTVN